jgi:hypothetical protein
VPRIRSEETVFISAILVSVAFASPVEFQLATTSGVVHAGDVSRDERWGFRAGGSRWELSATHTPDKVCFFVHPRKSAPIWEDWSKLAQERGEDPADPSPLQCVTGQQPARYAQELVSFFTLTVWNDPSMRPGSPPSWE